MLKEGKGHREIAKIVHVSFSYIEKVKRKYFEVDDDDPPQNIKRSQALKLMEEGKSGLEIAIELHLSAAEIKQFRQEHLTLKGDDQLLQFIRRVGGKTESFLKISEMMNDEDLDPQEAVWIIQDMGDFRTAEKQFTDLTKSLRPLREEVSDLVTRREKCIEQIQDAEDEVDRLEVRKQELIRKNAQLHNRQQEIGNIIQTMTGIVDRSLQNSDDPPQPQETQLDLDWIGKSPDGKSPDEPQDDVGGPYRRRKRSRVRD